MISLSYDIAIVVAWIPSDCLEINNSNVQSNKVNHWWKTLGRWQFESRNSSPWRYKFRKSWDKNKNHTRSVFCSTRTPWKITKAGDFFGGSIWTEYLTWWFLLLTRVVWRHQAITCTTVDLTVRPLEFIWGYYTKIWRYCSGQKDWTLHISKIASRSPMDQWVKIMPTKQQGMTGANFSIRQWYRSLWFSLLYSALHIRNIRPWYWWLRAGLQ